MGDRSRKTSLFSFSSPKMVEQSPQRRISLYQLQQVGNAISSAFTNAYKEHTSGSSADGYDSDFKENDELTAADGTVVDAHKTVLVIDSDTENNW